MRRRFAARIACLGLALVALVALGASTGSASTTTPTTTTIIAKKVPRSGDYAVVVTVPAPAVAESVSVFVGSQAQRDVAVAPGRASALAFHLHVRGKQLTVRTVSSGPAVHVAVAVARQRLRAGGLGATGTTGTTGATGATGTTILGPPRGPYTKLVWADEFNGPAATAPNPSKWTPDGYGGCGGGTLSNNTASPANASLDGHGHLTITAYQDATGAAPPSFTSAQLDTQGHFSFRYGRIEARIKIPAGSGLCSAFWMVGDSTTPQCFPLCGEIDIIEAISPFPANVFATLHGPVNGSQNFQQWQGTVTSATVLSAGFHTYGLVWEPDRLVWTLDGVPYISATPADLPPSAQWVFSGHSFHILLDLAVGGWPGPPASGAKFPAAMSVDWVRVYT